MKIIGKILNLVLCCLLGISVVVKVRWDGGPNFPRPAALVESEQWNPDYWSIGHTEADGKQTGWCSYQLNYLTSAAVEAMQADGDNYQDVVEVEGP